MRLLEFQGKKLLMMYGIRIPSGTLIKTPQDARNLSLPCILKAQVPVGGRGKAGAVRCVKTPDDAEAAAGEIFGLKLKEWPVVALMAEETAPAGREMYLSVLVDGRSGGPVVLASGQGGVDIEQKARQDPSAVLRRPIDSLLGVCDYDVRAVARHLGVDVKKLSPVLRALWRMFRECDASLVEINPLLETDTGFMALDAKVILDDCASFRHAAEFDQLAAELAVLDTRSRSASEKLAEAAGITYVPLTGVVGLISDGAGTGMLTLDLIHSQGGAPANFCEMGGLSNAETMKETLRVVLADQAVRSIVVSLIGGLTRMDEMAEGIVAYLADPSARQVPMAVRMCGTQADVGIPMLRDAGVSVYEDLISAVQEAVALAGGR